MQLNIDLGVVYLEVMAMGVGMNEMPWEGGTNSTAMGRTLGNSIRSGMS